MDIANTQVKTNQARPVLDMMYDSRYQQCASTICSGSSRIIHHVRWYNPHGLLRYQKAYRFSGRFRHGGGASSAWHTDTRAKKHQAPIDELSLDDIFMAQETGYVLGRGVTIQFQRWGDLLHTPGIHHNNAISQFHCFVLIVGNVQRGGAVSLEDSPYITTHLGPEPLVKAAQGLIQQENVGPYGQRSGHGYPLLLASTERMHSPLTETLQVHQGKYFLHPCVAFRLWSATDLQTVGDVIGYAHVGEQRIVLKNHGSITFARRNACHRHSVYGNGTTRNRQKTGYCLEQRRLATARRAEHGNKLAITDLERNPVKNFFVAIG